LDKDAVALVRRAGPFPAPPAGAQRSFKIRIKGR
jgi:protein TonB